MSYNRQNEFFFGCLWWKFVIDNQGLETAATYHIGQFLLITCGVFAVLYNESDIMPGLCYRKQFFIVYECRI